MSISYRDFAEIGRMPSSLGWLIHKQARIKGNLARDLKLLEQLPERIERWRAEIKALDIVIPLHEVQIDPGDVKPRAPKSKAICQQGSLTRSILQVLRLANGEPVYTSAISMHVIQANRIDLDVTPRKKVLKHVSACLGYLARAGVVQRRHLKGRPAEGRWSLPIEDD